MNRIHPLRYLAILGLLPAFAMVFWMTALLASQVPGLSILGVAVHGLSLTSYAAGSALGPAPVSLRMLHDAQQDAGAGRGAAPSTPTPSQIPGVPQPTPSATGKPSPTPTPVIPPLPVPTPTPTALPVATPTPSPLPVATPTPTPLPVATPTPAPAPAPTPTPTPTPTPSGLLPLPLPLPVPIVPSLLPGILK